MKHKVYRKLVLFFINHFFAGTHLFKTKRKMLNSAGYCIGKNTKVVGPLFVTGELKIGSDCWVGRDFTVNGNGTVEIGNNCDIAPSVCFLTGSHEVGESSHRAGSGKNYLITVEDGCWLGARSTFVNSIRINKGSVVAACACVTKDIPQNKLVGGVPARIIKDLH